MEQQLHAARDSDESVEQRSKLVKTVQLEWLGDGLNRVDDPQTGYSAIYEHVSAVAPPCFARIFRPIGHLGRVGACGGSVSACCHTIVSVRV